MSAFTIGVPVRFKSGASCYPTNPDIQPRVVGTWSLRGEQWVDVSPPLPGVVVSAKASVLEVLPIQ